MEQLWSNDTVRPSSTVPRDQLVGPGEHPFTCFGQFEDGMIDLRVFDQEPSTAAECDGIYWVDRSGAPHLVSDMSEDYVRNVIAFLTEHCEVFYLESARRAILQSLCDQVLTGQPSGEVLLTLIGGATWSDLTPAHWLESTSIMRLLRRRLAQFD